MGGGLMQLVAYGAQDIYLTGNPQITFFKVVYRRHTNFSMESIEQTFNGTPAHCGRVSCTISRNGDLVHKMHLRFANGAGAADCSCSTSGIRVGCNIPCSPIPLVVDDAEADKTSKNANDLIKSIEVEIGGQRVDKHYGDWLNIWAQLTTPVSKNDGLSTMLDLDQGDFSYVPLRFWFNRNPGLALPLIALQYHEVKLNVEFASASENLSGCGGTCELTPASTDVAIAKTKLYVDYIYLDTDERRRFAQVSHEYLIEQLQFTGSKTVEVTGTSVQLANVSERLNFNHPVKELIWRASGLTQKREASANNSASSSGLAGRDFDANDNNTGVICVTAQWSDITLPDTANISVSFSHTNTTPRFLSPVVFMYTLSLSNQKNTNLPVPAISQELTTLFLNLTAAANSLTQQVNQATRSQVLFLTFTQSTTMSSVS